MGLAVLNTERVIGYAEHWRSLARGWTRMAGKAHDPHSAKLRHAAQMALYAAYEAEQLLKSCRAIPYEAHEQTPAAVPALLIPEPVAAVLKPPPLRHGPLGYFGPMGPVSLAGQRPRSGPYSGRQAARFG
jgi:hypothetical protein